MKAYLVEKTGEKPLVTTNLTTAARTIKAWLDEEESYEWLNVWDIENCIESDHETGEESTWFIVAPNDKITAQVVEIIEG